MGNFESEVCFINLFTAAKKVADRQRNQFNLPVPSFIICVIYAYRIHLFAKFTY